MVAGFGIQFSSAYSQQVPLEEAVGKHNKYNLIDDDIQRYGALVVLACRNNYPCVKENSAFRLAWIRPIIL